MNRKPIGGKPSGVSTAGKVSQKSGGFIWGNHRFFTCEIPKYVDFKSCTSSLSRSLTFSNHFLETSWGKELPAATAMVSLQPGFCTDVTSARPGRPRLEDALVGSTWFNLSQDIPVWFPSFRLENVFKKWNHPPDHWLDHVLGELKTSLQLATPSSNWLATG